MVFEEDNNWNWSKGIKEVVDGDVNWGNDDGETNAADTANGDRIEIDEVNEEEQMGNRSSNGISSNVGEELNGQRVRQEPTWMRDYVSGKGLSEEDTSNFVMFARNDPICFEKAQREVKWRTTMDAEIEAIKKNDAWELIELLVGAKKVNVKWVYKTKFNENGDVDKYKARLVAKGYTQKYGIYYTEVFALVARLETIQLVISIATQKKWKILQLDLKSTFLHGELNKEVFIEQPPDYQQKGAEQKVYKLKKALYGITQAP